MHPAKNKFDWEADELGLRSVLLDATGRTISVGWPKFFNQGEWPDHDSQVAEALSAGQAVITHKHDGSLIIRSVLPDGRVIFRTRGSADGGDYGIAAQAVAQAKYPNLLDPTVFPHGSLLFEYVGAANQIVVRYSGDDDLVFLGAALHTEPVRYLAFDDITALAERLGLRRVEVYDWTASDGIATVLGLVQGWDHAEGVVIRTADGQTMLKVKSAWYFAQHALRWHVSLPSIARFCIDAGLEDEPSFRAKLTEIGWDYETAAVAVGFFRQYLERRAEAARIEKTVRELVERFDAETAGTFPDERARRKAFATLVFGPSADPERRALSGYCFYAYDGKFDHLKARLLQRIVLGS